MMRVTLYHIVMEIYKELFFVILVRPQRVGNSKLRVPDMLFIDMQTGSSKQNTITIIF